MRSAHRAACLSSCSAMRCRSSRRLGSVSRDASSLYVCAASTSRRHISWTVATSVLLLMNHQPPAFAASSISGTGLGSVHEFPEYHGGRNAGADENHLAQQVRVDLAAMQIGNEIRHGNVE